MTAAHPTQREAMNQVQRPHMAGPEHACKQAGLSGRQPRVRVGTPSLNLVFMIYTIDTQSPLLRTIGTNSLLNKKAIS